MARKVRSDKGKKVGMTTAQLLRRVTTINDLLARDDVNGILKNLDGIKPNITDCIVIYIDKRDKKRYWQATEETTRALATWMLESTKLDILMIDDKEE